MFFNAQCVSVSQDTRVCWGSIAVAAQLKFYSFLRARAPLMGVREEAFAVQEKRHPSKPSLSVFKRYQFQKKIACKKTPQALKKKKWFKKHNVQA